MSGFSGDTFQCFLLEPSKVKTLKPWLPQVHRTPDPPDLPAKSLKKRLKNKHDPIPMAFTSVGILQNTSILYLSYRRETGCSWGLSNIPSSQIGGLRRECAELAHAHLGSQWFLRGLITVKPIQ